jgi:hypothetical protein
LGDATGQAGALGDPKAIFPTIDENLSHRFIMPDSDGSGRKPWPRWAWASCSGLRVSPRANQNPPRSPHPANRRACEGRGRPLEPSLSLTFPAILRAPSWFRARPWQPSATRSKTEMATLGEFE